MNIDKINGINKQQQIIKKEQETTTTPVNHYTRNIASAPTNPALYAAYNNIHFTGKENYDKSNFREELKSRAQISTTKIKINQEEKELDLYNTSRSEYVLVPDSDKIYKLRYCDNQDRIKQQVIASKLYQSVGIRTPEYISFEKDGKTGYLVEVIEEKLYPANTNKEALYESFVADVWLGNRNGLSKGNTMIDKDGNAVKLSVSGSLGYRACGKPKSDKFGQSINEINTMRDASKNPDAANALAQMTPEDLYSAIDRIKERYSIDALNEIVPKDDKYTSDTLDGNLYYTLQYRMPKLDEFVKTDSKKTRLEKRELREDNPRYSNVLYPESSFAQERASQISDEEWAILGKRDLFTKHHWLKPLHMSDYQALAKMTDEQHQIALRRNLYAPRTSDNSMYGSVSGREIAAFTTLTDEEWEIAEKRGLLDMKATCKISEFFLKDFVKGVVDISDLDWAFIVRTNFLHTNCKVEDIKRYVELRNDRELVCDLEPDFDIRVQTMALLGKNEKYSTDIKFEAKSILKFALLDNKQWNRLVECTDNFTDIKAANCDTLNSIINVSDSDFETLKKRGLLKANHPYGLNDILLLSDEEWENINKRGLIEKYPNSYAEWAALGALTDKEYQFAIDKHLFDERPIKNCQQSGQAIASIVKTLNEKDWENVEKRGLQNDFILHSMGYGNYLATYGEFISLAKMSDHQFEKFKKLNNEMNAYVSTKLELSALPDEEYAKVFRRNLFEYQNCYESWDNYTEDAPMIKRLAELSDEDFEAFKAQKNSCKDTRSKILIIELDKMKLNEKNNISELSFAQKKALLDIAIKKGHILKFTDFINNYESKGLTLQLQENYVKTLQKLIKSCGIDTKPLNENKKAEFFSAIDTITATNSEFSNLNLKAPDFELTLQYPRENFINDVLNKVSELDEKELMKVWDYFGFELKYNQNRLPIMFGYPASINNGEKLKEITNPQTRETIEKIRPLVQAFTENNKIQSNKHISENLANTLNEILDCLPEFYSIIGKKQHDTHDYTIDVHSLSVLQECIKQPFFETLSKTEKQNLVLTSLLHDITKEEYEIDKSHPKNSAYDAFFILKKFGLSDVQHSEIYNLIRHHDLLEQCNKKIYNPITGEYRKLEEDEQNALVKKYAYNLRAGNNAKLACMFTKADLLSVKRDGSFFDKYGSAFRKVESKLIKEVEQIKSTAIPLPQTRIPKASQMTADGVNLIEEVTYGTDRKPIKNKVLYLHQGMNLEKYGFDKNVTTDNLCMIAHGFDNEESQTMLEALSLPEQDSLLSVSYIVYNKGNYHTFRPQGYILDVQADDIGVAYYKDFGSGYKKTEESLVENYLNGGLNEYRIYISDLIKERLNLTDEQYVNLYEAVKNKPLNELEKKYPYFAYAIKDIFKEMEIAKRKFGRDYNEALVTKQKPVAIYYVGKNIETGCKYQIEDVPENLRKYAEENDLPIIYLGE